MIRNVANLVLELNIKSQIDMDVNYKIIFYSYSYGDIFIIYNNTNNYITFNNIEDINEYISEYIDTYTENNENYIDQANITIFKNNSVFINKNIIIDHENPDVDVDDEVYNIKFYYKKYLILLSKIDKEHNRRIYEIVYKCNNINTKLPIELLENILYCTQ